jgi:hypothetical protein
MSEVDEILAELGTLRERLILALVRERDGRLTRLDCAELAWVLVREAGDVYQRSMMRTIREMQADGRLITERRDGEDGARHVLRPGQRDADGP